MAHDGWAFLFGGFVVFGIAVAVKAARALRARRPYMHAFWDGGLAQAGAGINRLGTQIKLGAALGIAAGSGALLIGAVPVRPTSYVLMAIVAINLVSDAVNADKRGPTA